MEDLSHLCSGAQLQDQAGGQDNFPTATALGIAADLDIGGGG